MEERLKNLKKLMDQRTFKDVTFTEHHRKRILEKTNHGNESEEDIQLAVMQLLVHAKTGYELTVHLRGRGIKKFEHNEGALYTILHSLEQSGCLRSNWDATGGKYYELNDRGKKRLKKAENKQTKQQVVFKEVLEGWQD
jgi:DNA-binding PadR family transcriptional regulator